MDSVPLLGGTLEPVEALDAVVAADPEHDRLLLAAADGAELVEIPLGRGARPFRVLVDGATVHATLRGTGEVAAVDLHTRGVAWSTWVCPEPRGLDRLGDGFVVACAGGELVELDAAGEVVRSVIVATDLRDVVVTGENLFVSRFRRAEVLRLDPESFGVRDVVNLGGPNFARVLWRMRRDPGIPTTETPDPPDGVIVTYQVPDAGDPIVVSGEPGLPGEPSGTPYGVGGDGPFPDGDRLEEPCDGLHPSAFATVSATGAVFVGPTLRGVITPVDVWRDGRTVYVVNGGAGPDARRGAVVAFELPRSDEPLNHACRNGVELGGRSTDTTPSAVALLGDTLYLQGANPPTIRALTAGGARTEVLFSGAGHERAAATFHRDPGTGISCASCHPEGTDDGVVWQFRGLLPADTFDFRKTMTLAGEPSARAPYHWYGELDDAHALVETTFVDRMGGDDLDARRTRELFDWLDGLRVVRASPDATFDEVEHGEAVFRAAGCDGCHAGPLGTNGQVEEIRGVRGHFTKTPALVGLGLRSAFMHDGCASSIEERLSGEARCTGGAAHGNLRRLDEADLTDLASYLRSL